jgi:hypothetical protein
MKRLLTTLAVALSCLFVLVLLAVSYVIFTADVSTSSTSMLSTGRTVTATYHGWSGIGVSDNRDSTTINMAGRHIVVAPTSLVVQGRTIATIDAKAKSIDIDGDRHAIRFTADGKLVATIQR